MTKYAIIATEYGDDYYIWYDDGCATLWESVSDSLLFDNYDEAQAVIDGMNNGTIRKCWDYGDFTFKIVEYKN